MQRFTWGHMKLKTRGKFHFTVPVFLPAHDNHVCYSTGSDAIERPEINFKIKQDIVNPHVNLEVSVGLWCLTVNLLRV